MPRTESLAMPEAVPASGRVRNVTVFGLPITLTQLVPMARWLRHRLVGSGLASRYQLQSIAGFLKVTRGRCKTSSLSLTSNRVTTNY